MHRLESSPAAHCACSARSRGALQTATEATTEPALLVAQAQATLSDGRVFAIGGSWSGGYSGQNGIAVKNGEVGRRDRRPVVLLFSPPTQHRLRHGIHAWLSLARKFHMRDAECFCAMMHLLIIGCPQC